MSAWINDGGPAFPGGCILSESNEERGYPAERGMSLRDYFAAHAPGDYASWFEPQMPPRPQPQYDHDHPNETRCQFDHDCLRVNDAELRAYDDERRKQYELQWPYAWADAMLRERERQS